MTVVEIEPIDWWRVIMDLERNGVTMARIAAECLRSVGWVSNLKNIPGTEPRHRDGVVLLAMWSERTGRPATEAPRVRDPLRDPFRKL